MKFKLPEINLSQHTKLYCGKEARLATATAVAFVEFDKILVSNLLGQIMYLIDISKNNLSIINQIHTGVYSDLIDYRNGKIISANALSPEHPDGTISTYQLDGNCITFIKNLIIKKKLRIHGCRFIDDSNILVASNDKTDSGIYFINLDSENNFKYINFQLKVKDLYILDDRLFVIASKSAPTKNGGYIEQQSILYLYKFSSMEKLDELVIDGQVDAMCMLNNVGLITVQGKHSLFYFEVLNDRLIYKKYIPGFNFPHGISAMKDRIIVTNYGDNSIDIINLNELVN